MTISDAGRPVLDPGLLEFRGKARACAALSPEDDQRVAGLLQRGLEELGYASEVAFDGEMGLRLFRSVLPDAVVSDIVLPKKDGFEVVKEIKAQDPSVPVILLTALGTTDDKLDGFDAGAGDYMVKPFDIRVLDAQIRVLLRRKPSGPGAGDGIELRRIESGPGRSG